MKRVVLAALLAAAPAAQCTRFEYRPRHEYPFVFAWHSFIPPAAAYVDFVPFNGEIAAVMLWGYGRPFYSSAERPLCSTILAGCDRVDMKVLGWWWSDPWEPLPGDLLYGPVPNAPVVDLNLTRTGFIVYPAPLPISAQGECVGMRAHREIYRYECPPVPYLAAYFVAPMRGWW